MADEKGFIQECADFVDEDVVGVGASDEEIVHLKETVEVFVFFLSSNLKLEAVFAPYVEEAVTPARAKQDVIVSRLLSRRYRYF